MNCTAAMSWSITPCAWRTAAATSTMVRFGKRAASSFSTSLAARLDAKGANEAGGKSFSTRGGAMTKKLTFIESQRKRRSEVMRALKDSPPR